VLRPSNSIPILGVLFPALTAWYEEQMTKLKELPIMKFFNANRVHTIYKGVVKPLKQVAPIWNLKKNGVPLPDTGQATVTFWRFDDVDKFIPGSSGGVFRLCEEYYLILLRLVTEWIKKERSLG